MSFHQSKCASVTRFPSFLHAFAIVSSPTLFSTNSLFVTGSFICWTWINIVDGTNIVNLLEEWNWLNSILADNTKGNAVRDGATLLSVICSREGIGLNKRVMQSLLSLKPECPFRVGVKTFCCCIHLFDSFSRQFLGLFSEHSLKKVDMTKCSHGFVSFSFCQSCFLKGFKCVCSYFDNILQPFSLARLYSVWIVILQTVLPFFCQLIINKLFICAE